MAKTVFQCSFRWPITGRNAIIRSPCGVDLITFGLETGVLAPGAPADFMLLDAGAPWRIDTDHMVGRDEIVGDIIVAADGMIAVEERFDLALDDAGGGAGAHDLLVDQVER